MANPQTFTLPQIAEITGVEYRTLHTWLERGLLFPSRERANGAGTANVFDRADALEACMLSDLRRAGLEIGALEDAARALRRLKHSLTGDELLFINGAVNVLVDASGLPEAVQSGTPGLIYDVARARQALELSSPGSD